MQNSCIIHKELFPITITPEEFLNSWKINKDEFLKIHTRKINRQLNIQDEQGRKYHLIIRKGEAHLIPQVKEPLTNKELTSEIQYLKRLVKELDFLDSRLRTMEGNFNKVFSELKIVPENEAEDETLTELGLSNTVPENTKTI